VGLTQLEGQLKKNPWHAINLMAKTQPCIRLGFLFLASQNGAIWLHGAYYLIG